MFGVSKRLVQFICCPDKAKRAKELLKQRKSDGRYKPTKSEWAATIREHRRYKETLKKGVRYDRKKHIPNSSC